MIEEVEEIEKDIVDIIERQDWIDKISDPVHTGVDAFYRSLGGIGKKIENFLNGTWLGHPLHPVLTDIPTGSFTTAVVLDVMESTTGKKAYGKGADIALAVGVAGGVASAVSGLTDWHYLGKKRRRFGMIHALLNITSLVFYSGSLALRGSKKRSAGRWMAYTGYALTTVAAYLGGDLVYRQKIGVNHAPEIPVSDEWKFVMFLDQVREGELQKVDFNGIPVLLVRQGDQVYAIAETCAHLGGPLSEGELRDDFSVVCPWHGSRYDLKTGKVLDGPSAYPQPCFQVRVQNSRVEIKQTDPAFA